MKTLLLMFLIAMIPFSVSHGNVDIDDECTIDGTLLVKETIEAFQDIETAGAFVGPDADIDEIKQWIPFTVVFGAEQGNAYPDTVSKARDVFAFIAPVAGDIGTVVLYCNASGAGGDSLTVDVTIEGTSVFTTGKLLKMTPSCAAKDNSIDCSYGRGSSLDLGKDDCSAGELIELDLDTHGTYTTDPDGVVVTIYFSPDH
jgi:hypothetical protein